MAASHFPLGLLPTRTSNTGLKAENSTSLCRREVASHSASPNEVAQVTVAPEESLSEPVSPSVNWSLPSLGGSKEFKNSHP